MYRHISPLRMPPAAGEIEPLSRTSSNNDREEWFSTQLANAHKHYLGGEYHEALLLCESLYQTNAYRTDNLLLIGAIHFQQRNFSESIFYNQQCIRIDPSFAEAYGNLGNALKELGDMDGAIQFYLKAIKMKPRFSDAYNNLASAYMQQGKSNEAIETYRMALVLSPTLVDAHSNLGNLFKTQGRYQEAKVCYQEAIRLAPDFAVAWNNYAGLLNTEGDLTGAIAHYEEALRLAPQFADAASNLGNVYKATGRLSEAMASYKEAIRLRPEFAIAHGNLASCYYEAGDLKVAIRTFRLALTMEPNFPDAYNNLGNALREGGQLNEAIQCYQTTLRLKPDHPHAYNNLGNALKDIGMIKEAIHCYMTAAKLMPSFAAAHSNLGSVMKEQGKLHQSLAHYQHAVTIDPSFADGFSNMGNVYKELSRMDEAIACYTTALRLNPSFADAYANLANAYKDSNKLDEAITCYRKALELRPSFPDAFSNYFHSLMFVCDWQHRDRDFATLMGYLTSQLASQVLTSRPEDSHPVTVPALPSVQPFHALVYPVSLETFHAISKQYAARAAANIALCELSLPFVYPPKSVSERLKIGYVSSDFGNHPLSHLMQSVFGLHNRMEFDITCYALSSSDGSVWRASIEASAEHFMDVSAMTSEAIASLIHADGIDILVNLNGYTKGARNEIFVFQPAPLQVSYLGFCGTLGAPYVQYMVGDTTVVPPSVRPHYSEKIINLPHSYFVNDHAQSAREVLNPDTCPTRQSYNLPDDAFVFCNFNQLYKIDPLTFTCWMNILKRVPNSILWLLRFPSMAETNLVAEAKACGIRAHRLHFTDVAPKLEHLKRGYLADLFLDTPECNAHTTGCDILWGGTPMITLAKEKMASRVGASLLAASELSDCITTSLVDYEELAVCLALDLDKLWEVRKRLEAGRTTCPLFDTARWVKNLERGLGMVWDRHTAGQAPDHIDVLDVLEVPTIRCRSAADPSANSDNKKESSTGATSDTPAASDTKPTLKNALVPCH